MKKTARRPNPRAILFDVFGTVVDWHGSIAREAAAIARGKGIKGDWGAFALAWRAGYQPAMHRVRRGELPWMNIDALHRLILDGIVPDFGLDVLDEAERDHLNRAWHRLKPWPDSVRGLKALKRHCTIATLSNGNVGLLVDMARHSGLPWDMVFSAELFHHYKPDPETYLGACNLLGRDPGEVMLCAAHKDDLQAAQALGLRAAFVRRPLEFGPTRKVDTKTDARFDYNVSSFIELGEKIAKRAEAG
jgi:2-haloacid dehalogenase